MVGRRLRLRRPEAPPSLGVRRRGAPAAPPRRRRRLGFLVPAVSVLALPAYLWFDSLACVEARGVVSGRVVAVGTPIRGILASIAVTVGERVEAGAELARLDTAPLEARRARARAGLAEARAREVFAAAEWRRVRRLVGAGVESMAHLERARARWEAARAATAAAAAAVAETEALLRQVILRAPVDGVVLRPPLPPGSVVEEDTVVVTLLDDRFLWVVAYVPESDRARLRRGLRAEVEVEGLPGQVLEGRVAEIYREVRFRPRGLRTYDTPAETYQPVRIVVTDTALLRARASYGMRAVVRIHVRE